MERYSVAVVGVVVAALGKDKIDDSKAYLVNVIGYSMDSLLIRLAILT